MGVGGGERSASRLRKRIASRRALEAVPLWAGQGRGQGGACVPVAWIPRRNSSGRCCCGASGPARRCQGLLALVFKVPEEERVRLPTGRPSRPAPNSGSRAGPGSRTPDPPHSPHPDPAPTLGVGSGRAPAADAPPLLPRSTRRSPSLCAVLGERCRFPTPCSARSRSTFRRSCRTS